MSEDRFASAVTDWAKKTEHQQAEVLHESLRQLDKEVEANVPVLTGNLKNSRAISTLAPVAIDWKVKKFREPDDAINNAIAGVEVGATAWLGFRAPYAHIIEEKYAYLRLAAQRWQQVVNEAARIVKARL